MRLRLTVSALAIALSLGVAAPALAQVGTPALPRALPAIPAPVDQAYPGVIRYEVDATDIDRKIISVRQTIPVSAGPLTLLYPKFIPGNHAATGPIQLIAGLTIHGDGDRIEWLRDTIDPYAFHIEVPRGVDEIVVEFQWLTQPDASNWRVVMASAMLNMQWEKAVLYPAGYRHSRITFAPSIRLPEGWQYGVAMDTVSFENGVATFAPVSLETLADSPMFAGAHYRAYDLDPGGRSPVTLHIVADQPEQIAPTPEQLAKYEALVDEADLLFGSRHFDRYEFLLGLTREMGGIGLEHHRSSENTAPPNFFGDGWEASHGTRTLLPHEFVHSWNGKFRRPADQLTPNLNVPVQNTLLWVYEGQTEYWGEVLTVRSGLGTPEEALASFAGIAAFYQYQSGREWRSLQDTTNNNLLGYRASSPWPSWMRGTGDYYRESALIWLDADTLIREKTGDTKSLNDFARLFFGIDDGSWEATPYTFDDVVAALNAVVPHDWAGFLRDRLDAVGPDARAPLDGIERGGYRLVYTDSPTEVETRINGSGPGDYLYSLGFYLAGGNRIVAVQWDSPIFNAGIGAGWTLVSVNGERASPEVLSNAITAARTSPAPIVLEVRNARGSRTLEIDYHDGLRYPRLERIPGTPDRLGDILSPMRD
ncbi:peptidase M61 [Brevundimonas sp.]|uniref:M61 family metallopeptidase n=1 Tax=Brevundimonas sp. TaxID=1871086 RepID=UPI001DDABB5B|nr:peptidase M61 [Brevundimonas sp.]MBL0947821.1 M61 family metallopeptidase [Brevundimonas sp.]